MASFLHTIIIYPLYLIIEIIYKLFLKLSDNQGISVIGVSVGITLLCLPLYAVAEHWQQVERDVQAKMKGGLDRIKKTFSGDERYMMTQTFYKQHHYSPIMALRSSFGLLIQIPFFMAAYQFLSGLESLKGVSFLFIRDMGVPDATFHIGSFPVNVLPIAMTLINMIAGAVYTKGLVLREKIQVHGMALIFLAILYNSPSGLVLYWTMNNVFSLVKNIFYKLKNPLKVFWICSCALCSAAFVYILFFYTTKKVYKLAFLFFVLMTFAAPLFVKLANKLLDTILAPLVENKRERHSLFFIAAISLFVIFGLTIPSSLISSSAAEFTGLGGHGSPFFYIGNACLQAAAIFLFWFPCVYFLFNKMAQALLALAASILSISAVLNAYPFMLRYGDISASLVFLNVTNFRSMSLAALINILALAAAAAIAVLSFKIKKAKILPTALAILALALFGSFAANSAVINANSKDAIAAMERQKGKVDLKAIFHLSKNKPNVILIMLDRAVSAFIEENLKEDPNLKEQFSGFVFYKNVASFNGHTLLGAPPLFGGYEYTPLEMQKRKDVTREQKVNESQLVLPRIFNESLGYSASVNDPFWVNSSNYCDLSFLNGYDIDGHQTIGSYSQQWYKANPNAEGLDSTEEILKRNLLFFSLFRCSPICLREAVYLNGTYFNAKDNIKSTKKIIDNYSVLDFLPELSDIQETKTGSYISVLNELTHEDFYFEA
ncbi:MAG: YidC/Oxa1 family membrane protein insertase, partial [Treponema sp.]|nr:YidC/Oxa1 family membrane protein insertase [Treponema sp.]